MNKGLAVPDNRNMDCTYCHVSKWCVYLCVCVHARARVDAHFRDAAFFELGLMLHVCW
jgi:hypothetical protein